MVLCFRIDLLFLRGENDDFDSMVAAAFLCNYEIPVKEQLNSSVFITIYIAYTIFFGSNMHTCIYNVKQYEFMYKNTLLLNKPARRHIHSWWIALNRGCIHSEIIHWSKKSLHEHPTTKGSITGLYSNTPLAHPTLRRTIWYWKVGTHLEKARGPRVLSNTDRHSVHLHRRWTIVWGILLTSTSVTR